MNFNAGVQVIGESALAAGAGAGVGLALGSSNLVLFGAACGLTFLIYNIAKTLFNIEGFVPKFATLTACSFGATLAAGFNVMASANLIITGIAISMLMRCSVSAAKAAFANADF